MLVNNKKKHITYFLFISKGFPFHAPLLFHSIFEFVLTVLLSGGVNVSFVERAIPLLSSEVAEWTDCNSLGDCGTLPCEAASAAAIPMSFELACLKWSLNFNCTTLMAMDVRASPKIR